MTDELTPPEPGAAAEPPPQDCGHCKFVHTMSDGSYCCRRYPPAARIYGPGFWPTVRTFDTCGEWQSNAPPAIAKVWKYRANVNMADPSNGNVRFNQSTLTAATAAVVSNRTQDGTDVTAQLATLTIGDEIEIHSIDVTRWARFRVTAPVMPKTGYAQLALTHVASSNPAFTDAEDVTLRWVPVVTVRAATSEVAGAVA